MSHHFSISSLKEKLQLDSINPLYVVGVGLILCVVLVLTGQALWQSFSGSHITFEQTETPSPEEQVNNAAGSETADGVSVSEAQTPTMIYVHVSGAVCNPGLYEIESGARIYDAIQAAGGMTKEAAENSVNLAQIIEDGSHITVLTKEEQQSATSGSKESSGAASSSKSNTQSLVNINTATVEELTTLKGVGEATAEKIIADREQKGAFKSKEDLKRVSGIGDKKYESLKDYITV